LGRVIYDHRARAMRTYQKEAAASIYTLHIYILTL